MIRCSWCRTLLSLPLLRRDVHEGGTRSMIRHRYYVGTVTQDGRPVPAVSVDACADLLIKVYGGYSLFHARGAWSDKGEIKREPSRVYECLEDGGDEIDVKGIARDLAQFADQTTVLWTAEVVEGGFSA